MTSTTHLAVPPGDEIPSWKNFYWYHCIDLGNGVVTDGNYDMREYLPHYRFPEDLAGKRVLDVGPASGFFSFEFERRGADVTATEIASFLDWDFVGGEAEKRRQAEVIGDVRAHTRTHITGAFHHAYEALGSKVKLKWLGVYDLRPEELDNKPFDLVFAGSITSHLRDPILALECLRSVTAGTCIVALPALEDGPHPLMALVETIDSDRRSWSVPNSNCLVEMLHCPVFSHVEIVSRFLLVHRKLADQRHYHLVAYARP